jgi:hypothetical protein
MNDEHFKMLLDNDKEWRSFMINKIESIHVELTALKSWSLVFRLAGSAAFAILLVWLEYRLTNGGV